LFLDNSLEPSEEGMMMMMMIAAAAGGGETSLRMRIVLKSQSLHSRMRMRRPQRICTVGAIFVQTFPTFGGDDEMT
jgi:hypothetical protein